MSLLHRRGALLLGLLVVGWGLLAVFFASHFNSLYDDAYIFFRYADNIVGGCGVRYSCGQAPVEGFSSPLYLVLLVLGRLATPDLESLSQLLGLLAMAGVIALAAITPLQPRYRLERWSESVVLGGATVLFLGLDGYLLSNAVNGMETALATLIVTTVLLASSGTGTVRLQAMLMLAVLVRPECLLFLVAAPMLPQGRRLRFYLPLASILLMLVGARLMLFGEWLPNTYFAKSGGTWIHARLGAAYVFGIVREYPVILLAPLALLHRRARPPAAAFLVVTLLWFGFFLRSGGDHFGYYRLAAPLLPGLVFLGLFGAGAAVDRLWRATPGSRGALRWVGLVTVWVTLVVWTGARHGLPSAHGFRNVQRWARIGRFLRVRFPGARVAVVPIGAIGYTSKLEIIDLVGLVHAPIAKAGLSVPPAMLRRRWLGHERHDTDWVLAQRPDVIVMATKCRLRPWRRLAETRAGFYAEWLLLRRIKQGRAGYRLFDAEVRPGLHCEMFVRSGWRAGHAVGGGVDRE